MTAPAAPRGHLTDQILSELLAARAIQDGYHGQQGHPDGTSLPGDTQSADMATRHRQQAETGGTLAWRHLVTEAWTNARAESHPVRLRGRLLYLATTVVAWIEDADRRIAEAAAAYTPPEHYLRADGARLCVHTVPVAAGSCADCWDLAKWDALEGQS